MGKTRVRRSPRKLGSRIGIVFVFSTARGRWTGADGGASGTGQRDTREAGRRRASGLDVLVRVVGDDGRRRRHCENGRLQAPAGETNAGAGAEAGAVFANGALDGKGAWHLTLATEALLGECQKRILVADVVGGSGGVGSDGQIWGVVVGRGRGARELEL